MTRQHYPDRTSDSVTSVIVAFVLTAVVALAFIFDRDLGPMDRTSMTDAPRTAPQPQ
jgi:hypothetical protein